MKYIESKDDKKIKIAVKGSLQDQSLSTEIEGDAKTIKEFFSGIAPEFLKDGVGILSDNVKFWRWNNQVSIIKKAAKKVEESGLPKQQIPLKVLAPIIELSSLEEEETMQEKWANMLANAASGRVSISPNYSAILNELSPTEVSILDAIFKDASKETDYKNRKKLQFGKDKIIQAFNLTEEGADLIVCNLYRLNLLQAPAGYGVRTGDYPFALSTIDIFELTPLGYEFIRACNWEENR